MTDTESLEAPKPERLIALDAYRGFVMFSLVSGWFAARHVAANFPDNAFWKVVHTQFEHVAWTGCTLWDLIQPSFMFIAGVAMPYSYFNRLAKGKSHAALWRHTLIRALILIWLGVFLRSDGAAHTRYTFEDVISQIGLAYPFVFACMGRTLRTQAIIAGVVLFGYYLLFALWPLPGPNFDAAALELPSSWQQFQGYAAHWNRHTNPAAIFDVHFLQIFPHPGYTYNGGGYTTLNFIPSGVTILFGAMAGRFLHDAGDLRLKTRRIFQVGLAGLAAGLALDGHLWPFVDWTWSVAPVVKRIWTPSFTLFSTGWTLLLLAAFLYVIELRGYRRWTFPFVVMGMNSIALYVMEEMMSEWLRRTWRIHLGEELFQGDFGPALSAFLTTAALYGIVHWMYRRKIFIRV